MFTAEWLLIKQIGNSVTHIETPCISRVRGTFVGVTGMCPVYQSIFIPKAITMDSHIQIYVCMPSEEYLSAHS